MGKQKLLSIEWMKFFATMLITNSHLGVCYGRYEALATGGAIGNALFFFCSGFTLALGRFDRFDNWFKRRLYRLYPSVFAKCLVGIISVLIGAIWIGDFSEGYHKLLNGGGGYFIPIS